MDPNAENTVTEEKGDKKAEVPGASIDQAAQALEIARQKSVQDAAVEIKAICDKYGVALTGQAIIENNKVDVRVLIVSTK